VTCSPSAPKPSGSTSGRSRSGCWARVTRPTTPFRRRGCGSARRRRGQPRRLADNRGGPGLPGRAARERSPYAAPDPAAVTSPKDEALLADSVGLALLVVLDTLASAERIT
jgi:hypothetical protein